jgi:flagellar protein FliL
MADDKTSAPAGGGIKALIFACLGVIVMAAGAGFFAAPLVFENVEKPASPAEFGAETKPADEASTPGEPEAEAPALQAETLIVPIQPIVTNLMAPANVWIRIEGHLLVQKRAETKPEELSLKISQHLLAYLRTVKLQDLQGTHGLFAVQQDLNEVASTASGGLAVQFLLSSLVIE